MEHKNEFNEKYPMPKQYKDKPRNITRSVTLNEDDDRALRLKAERLGCSISEALRVGI